MLKKLLLVPLLTAICAAELISIANYTGKHDSKCYEAREITGTLVNDKLYTFGGCFRVPYVVDPESNNDSFMDRENHKNLTDISQVYDVSKDEWSFETKSPIPIKSATTQAVNNSIYFYNVRPENRWESVYMYKYDTVSKEWTTLPDIPFLWSGRLLSCYDGQDKVYFINSDGEDRNIIRTFVPSKDQWTQAPIFVNKRLDIRKMICQQDHLKMIAKEFKPYEDEDNQEPVWYSSDDDGPMIWDTTLELFSTSYLDGSTVADGYNFTGNYGDVSIPHFKNFVYLYNVRKTESIFYRLNTVTLENVTMATMPYDLRGPLIAPLNENELLLLGGSEPYFYGTRSHKNTINKYNHKLAYYPHKHEEL